MDRMKVVVFEIFPKVDKILNNLLKSMANVDLMDSNVNNTEEALELILEQKPDIVILGNDFPGKDSFYFTQVIRKEIAPAQVIMVAEVVSAEVVRQAMRAGACDFISYKNLTIEELSMAIERASQLVFEEKNAREITTEHKSEETATIQSKSRIKKTTKIIAVYSPKGGTGVSTIIANISRIMADQGQSVLVLDGDLLFGDMGVLLNQPSNHSIVDLARFEGNYDEEIVREVITPGIVDLLAAPPSIEKSIEITGSICENIINALAKLNYDILLINTSSHLSDSTLVILEKAESVLLVGTQEISTVRALRLFLDLVRTLSIDFTKFTAVINRFEKNSVLSLAKLTESLDMNVSYTIPLDAATVLLANNLGLPFAVNQKNLEISKSIYAITNYLLTGKDAGSLSKVSKTINKIKNKINKK